MTSVRCRAVFVLGLVLLTDGARPARAADPGPSPPLAAAAPTAACTQDDACGPYDSARPLICDSGTCQPTTREALWQHVRSSVPELAELQPESRSSIADWLGSARAVMLWFPARKEWPEAPAQCVSLRFHRNDDGTLSADVPDRFGQRAGAVGVWTSTITLGDKKSRIGSGRKLPSGGAEACGCYSDEAYALTTRSPDVLRYDGERFRITLTCPVVDVAADARCPSCMRCAKFELHRQFLSGHGEATLGPASVRRSGSPLSCAPCPAEARLPLLPRYNRVLKDLVFVRKAPGGSAFFRQRESCEQELKAKKNAPRP